MKGISLRGWLGLTVGWLVLIVLGVWLVRGPSPLGLLPRAGGVALGHGVSGGAVASTGAAPIMRFSAPTAQGISEGGMSPRLSAPLYTLAPRHDTVNGPLQRESESQDQMRLPPGVNQFDPVIQRHEGAPLIPGPVISFPGINIFSSTCNCAPPDTNGDVGPDHYVQTVNAAFKIWNKVGTALYGPANINTLWTGVGDVCGTTNRGDPVVLYDPIGDRWLITQFAFNTDINGNPVAPYYQCMAVSTGHNPTGSYWLYDWNVNNTDFTDYPKFGVWTDAFFMTTNNFGSSGRTGPQAFAFERVAMENGGFARFQFTGALGSSVFPILPADLDGRNLPSDGTTNLLVGFGGPAPMYKFHVDFNNVANSYFTNYFNLAVAGFTQYCFTCVPQPGTAQRLDSLSDRPLARLAYRNHLGYESLVWTHDVDVGGQHGGLRWYEVNNPYNAPFLYQQGTYAPDADNRWMGSIAEDNRGDIAAVYSVSSGSTFPSIRYAGRVLADPLGTFQGGLNFLPGSTSQVSGNRWGDYAGMVVDPNDDCTYWFTTEYNNGGDYAWDTQVGAFRFTECVSLPTYTPQPTLTPTRTPTRMPTNTPTRTPTPCVATLQGFVSYQGLPVPSTGNMQAVVLKLKPSGGGAVTTFNVTTDPNGMFTVNVSALAPGPYTWWLKSPRYLAHSGTLTLSGACLVVFQFGQQLAGDINNDNCVDITDFSTLRASFGKACGDPGYNATADYNNDCIVDVTDFSLLRGNFGTCGPPAPTAPDAAAQP